MLVKRHTFLALILLFAFGPAFAQSLSVRGHILDTAGAAVPNASIKLETSAGLTIASSKSDAAGGFTLSRLQVGDFVLDVPAASGFARLTMPLHLTASISDLSVQLDIAPVNQDVTVNSGQNLSTDPAANRDAVTVSGDDLRKLPAIDLDYVSALSSFLDPGSTGSGGVTLVVDGVEMKNAGVSPSAIQEVRINNDPYSAEFRSPGRGRIEITTKPGSPEYHGELNFIFRDAVFNAKNHFSVTRPPETRRLFEGHFTGPVGHQGNTTFIASGEYGQRNTQAAVNAIGLSGPILENVPTPSTNYQASTRVTHDFSAAHRLQLGYNVEADSNSNSGVGALVLPEAGAFSSGREDDAIFNDRIIVTPNLINQLQVTFEKDEDVTIGNTQAQSIQVNGAFTGGGAQADQNRTENTVHITEVVSWSHGRHYLRFGAQAPQMSRRAIDDHTNRLGTYQFNSLANYGPPNSGATPDTFTQQQGTGRGIYWINELGAFIQDQIKVNQKLQATFGLRYDWQTYLTDNNNFSPRVSLAYALDKKTIFRVGSGLFYDRTGGDYPGTFVLHNGTALYSIQVLDPSYPIASNITPQSVPSNIVREASSLVAPYSIQSSFAVERQLNKKTTVSATYRNSVQIKSFRSRDANAPILPANPVSGFIYPRPNSSFGRIQQIESGGRQVLNALDLTLRGQLGDWFSGQAQYTLSRADSNTGGINSFPQNQYQPNAEWGRASSDRLHVLNVLGQLFPDHWYEVGINAGLSSGTPYTETTGTDSYQTGLNNARPAGVGRNTLQAAGRVNLDVQWEHDFRLSRGTGDSGRFLTPGVSAFNVLNYTNLSGYVGAQNSTLFMQPTSAGNARQLQFSIGYRF